MSSVTFFLSSTPLKSRPNPHDKIVSVNEALKLGVNITHDFLLSENFDKDKPGVILVSDREINFNLDTGEITDGDFDDDFGIFLAEKPNSVNSNKDYFALFEITRYTKGRGEKIIEYIKDNLPPYGEIEFSKSWLGNETNKNLKTAVVHINELTAEHIEELINYDVCKEPQSDYRLIIKP